MPKKKHPKWQPDISPKPWKKSLNSEPSVTQQTQKEAPTDPKREFMRLFRSLTYSRNPYEVWNDFITMSACAFSNVFDRGHFAEREKLYLNIINRYKKNEQQVFPELLAATTMAFEKNYEQDFLGEMFMALGIANKNNGQFFTPYHICELMAMTTVGNVIDQVRANGYITIHDPCCGGGATLIAGVNVVRRQLEKERLNFQNHVFVTAQDVDFTVALMCYIQLSLLGVAGFVKVGNALTEPMTTRDSTDNYWFTPMYFSNIWDTRRTIDIFMDLLEETENEH